MRHLVAERGLSDRIQVDSAGTAAYHAGEPPDRRSAAAAQARGIQLGGRARQFEAEDFERFEYVLALDEQNHRELLSLAGDRQERLHLLRAFDPKSPPGAGVPDPYYGGVSGFDEVLDLCEAACAELLTHIVRQHAL